MVDPQIGEIAGAVAVLALVQNDGGAGIGSGGEGFELKSILPLHLEGRTLDVKRFGQ